MKISIVSTLYKSEEYIIEFFKSLVKEVSTLTQDYEIILVDDGSPDQSLKLALELKKANNFLKIIELSKNYGHHQAILTGLEYAEGDLVFLIDSDLEEDPKVLTQFYNHLTKGDVDVVFGVQAKRKGNRFERLSGEWFYSVFNKISSQKIPRNFVTARLMKKSYVQALLKFSEKELFLGGLFSLTGFKQVALPVVKSSNGKSTYNFSKRLKLFINAITSFTDKPLIITFVVGFIFTCVALAYAVIIAVKRMLIGSIPNGWTSLAFLILFMGSLNLLSMGIVSIYLSKIFNEVKNRPRTIIRKFYD